jgi:hypothetical protein
VGELLGGKEEFEWPVVVDGGCGEGFGDEGRLLEFKGEAEVENWMFKAWKPLVFTAVFAGKEQGKRYLKIICPAYHLLPRYP